MIFRLFIEVNPPKSTLVYLACVFSDLMIICIKPAIILHADCQSYVLCTYREKRDLTYILHSTESSWLQKGQRNLVAKNTFFLVTIFFCFFLLLPMIYCCVAPVDVWDMRYTVLYIFSVNDAPTPWGMFLTKKIRRRRKKKKKIFFIR